MSAVRGSVQMEVGGMEFLTRYSLSSMRHGSIVSSLEDFREQERHSITDKQWSWKLLRDQFKQKNMESLYRRYDDKLRLGFLSIFLIIMVVISISHLIAVILTSIGELHEEVTTLISYTLQAFVPIPVLSILFVERFTKRYKWLQLTLSIIIIIFLVLVDVAVILVPSLTTDDAYLRPAYYTNTLLACYIFLPIINHFVALGIGLVVSCGYIVLLNTITYQQSNEESTLRELGGDTLYLLGVNFLGIYYRLMNEIVSRRSFLDRRACVESTLKLNFEKEQEERLLSSILPEHIASSVRQDVSTIYQQVQSQRISGVAPTISNLTFYISKHDNVSILYADIVNYTMISTTLAPKVLVETLNELFAKFDEAAEEHDVLRIKFLGDCYYCVSGIPKANSQHAKSCVDLGLDMISIIKDVRESRKLNIDMRIGVHSGKVMSGIIGIKKWQYDIWSKDATIANKMESTGRAGKVHITKRTLEELGNSTRDYVIEPNFEAAKDPLLSKYKIETFLISNPSKNSEDYADFRVQYRRASVGMAKRMRKGTQRGRVSENLIPRNRTTAFIDNNLMAYRQMLRNADLEMSSIIDKMPSGIWGGYTHADAGEGEYNPMIKGSLLFKKWSWEKSFLMQPDLLFKYFVAASLIIFLLMMSIQLLTIENSSLSKWTLAIDIVLGSILIILQPLNWTQFFWYKYKGKEEPKNCIVRFFYDKSASIIWSATMRSVLYFFISTMLAISSLINLTGCDEDKKDTEDIEKCIPPWHLAQATFLALLLTFLFSRVFFVLKWTVGLIIMSIYITICWQLKTIVLTNGSSWNYHMDLVIAHTLAITFLTFTLLLIDRQTEFRRRLDYRWKRTLKVKQEDASNKKIVNNMLLHNILPAHVANIYLNTSRNAEELYYEEYDCVAVMFASLTDYRFSSDDGTEMSEETLLKLLNQLISDFDKHLMSSDARGRGLKVEKIKMAGWTYMAACGLDMDRHRDSISSAASSIAEEPPFTPGGRYWNKVYEENVVKTMVKFAAAMNEILVNFNRSSFQGINLKVGISHGVVTAGVVGSSKPLYDIWGHAVNMASRMDSTGEPGRIHVTENTAVVLDRQGILTQYRGKPFVKGAGHIRTYFVPMDSDGNLIKKEVVVPTLKLNPVPKRESLTITQL